VLGHEASVDDADHIQPGDQTISPQELEAQTFAAYFLMPPALVNRTLQGMGLPIKPQRMTHRQVYQFALELGVSYTAAVTHLANLEKITWSVAAMLRRTQPKDIKALIGEGLHPADSWADIWDLDEHDAGKTIYPRMNDELHVHLPELPSTGYVWTLVTPPSVDLRPVEHPIEPSVYEVDLGLLRDTFETHTGEPQRIGSAGERRLVYLVLRPGRSTLRLEKRRPWQRSAPPAAVFELAIAALPRPTGISEHGLSLRQQLLVA
jgi:predicted secreted protein